MFKGNNKDMRMPTLTSFCVFIVSFTYFTRYSSVSIVDFEQVNVCLELVF